MAWKTWLKSILSAVIGGAANSVYLLALDPEHFNFQGGLGLLAKASALGAILAVCGYLKKSPLPDSAFEKVEPTP